MPGSIGASFLRYGDLLLCAIWTLAAVAAVWGGALSTVRMVFSLPLLVLIPGYLLLAVLYPGADDLPPRSRIPLAIVTSAALSALTAYALSQAAIGVTRVTVSAALAVLVCSLALMATMRRWESIRWGLSPFISNNDFVSASGFLPPGARRSSIVLVIGMVFLAALSAVFLGYSASPRETFTEFLAHTTPDGTDPLNTTYSIEVRNHEGVDLTYSIEAYLADPVLDPGFNATRIRTLAVQPGMTVSVLHGSSGTVNLTVTGKDARFNRLFLLLFKGHPPPQDVSGEDRIRESYRNLSIVL